MTAAQIADQTASMYTESLVSGVTGAGPTASPAQNAVARAILMAAGVHRSTVIPQNGQATCGTDAPGAGRLEVAPGTPDYAAAQRFAALPASARHAWLVRHIAALRSRVCCTLKWASSCGVADVRTEPDPVTGIRLVWLYAIGRRVPFALIALAAIATGLRVALLGNWDAYGALQLPLCFEAAAAVTVVATTASPFGEPERVAGRWLPYLRSRAGPLRVRYPNRSTCPPISACPPLIS